MPLSGEVNYAIDENDSSSHGGFGSRLDPERLSGEYIRRRL
jgi:hypothetical protein